MPIPKPRGGETQDQYHSRCMRAIHSEYPQDQANAICYQTWRDSHKKVDQPDVAFEVFKQTLAEPMDLFDVLNRPPRR